jgi:hypothetical protein
MIHVPQACLGIFRVRSIKPLPSFVASDPGPLSSTSTMKKAVVFLIVFMSCFFGSQNVPSSIFHNLPLKTTAFVELSLSLSPSLPFSSSPRPRLHTHPHFTFQRTAKTGSKWWARTFLRGGGRKLSSREHQQKGKFSMQSLLGIRAG